MSARPHVGTTWAGLAAGPGAWAVNLQVNYAGVPWMCGHHLNFSVVLSVALATVALAGAFLSWRAAYAPAAWESELEAAREPQPLPFLAAVGIGMGVLFALVILTQGAASLVLDGCER